MAPTAQAPLDAPILPRMSRHMTAQMPDWLPLQVRHYLHHTEEGVPLRALARASGLNASTVMRQIRRCETRREDPLMDAALNALLRPGPSQSRPLPDAAFPDAAPATAQRKDLSQMTMHHRTGAGSRDPETARPDLNHSLPDEGELDREARRLLRRLSEPGAVLAFAPDMEKAVILREWPDGRSSRTAILERRVAQAFSLKNWISCRKRGRVSTYEITAAGRAVLRDMLEEDRPARSDHAPLGMAEAQTPFLAQPLAPSDWPPEAEAPRRRMQIGESPVAVLGRRMDRAGKPFLDHALVQAAERLREDFELARLSPRLAQNCERIIAQYGVTEAALPMAAQTAPDRARARVVAALRDLGPGLGDVALRVCCFLEGVESAERRMGWAARSGKIVLRIALQRLRGHYDATYGRSGPLIG